MSASCFCAFNKFLVCILTIYLNKLELGLDMYVCIHLSSVSTLWNKSIGLFSLRYPYFISDNADTVFSLLSILEGMLYSGSLYLALNMEYSIPGCRRVVHGDVSLARLEH